jgi:hypothetical protein
MLSCKEATRLVSEGLDRELPFWQRLALRLHVVMCRACSRSRFARQITALNRIISDHYGDDPPAEVSEHLPPDAEQRIKSSLRQAAPRADDQNGK